ncbi:17212_t:CDS:10 [Entrophospora sp. SA101]|nr:4203_t:CDS:10 [Entrophospora sp. SA101]CAJ0759914.1 17212_t:CDS:10 [Entrophospora sp. SA101]CAJ0842464.1 21546_t:CDS:10 [Entrophospora sp. SA101]
MSDKYDTTSVVVEFEKNNILDEISDTNSEKNKWKAMTKKVIVARRLLTVDNFHSPGRDPGIDPKNVDYDINYPCSIFVSDFGEDEVVYSGKFSNKDLEGFLEKDRPDKTNVRWINVNGISWDVIKTLALKFDLHPLSIEDALQNTRRTKLDQYQNHIYISLLLHTLNNEDVESDPERDDSSIIEGKENAKSFSYNSRKDFLLHGHQEGSRYLETHKLLRKLKLNVFVEQVSIFLLKDETLLTIFQHDGKPVYKPILARINQPKTLLRTAHDASLLMEAVIDTVVDLAMPIVDSYRHQIADLEGKLLIRPKMTYSHELHMISGELVLLKRTLGPVQSLVTLLREHEDKKDFISSLAKTYFMDVADHCNEIVDNLDTMTKISENLVNLTNENMRIIAIISVVFMPMTFIAGYFGMNFQLDFAALYYPMR